MEGSDDVRFFESVVRPICENNYDFVQCWQYSQKTKARVNSYLNSIRAMQDAGAADLIVVADLDESPCVTDRKERLLSSFRSLSARADGSSTRILVVCREIESWYLAGLNISECERIGISTTMENTDAISKEQFLSLIPEKYSSKTAFMEAILQSFDFETACSKNRSFLYFMQKYGANE